MDEAAVQAELMKQFQQPAPPQQEGLPAGTDPNDPTGAGGGTIGTGIAPTPNEEGFTGNEQQGAPEEAQPTGQQPQGVGTVQ